MWKPLIYIERKGEIDVEGVILGKKNDLKPPLLHEWMRKKV